MLQTCEKENLCSDMPMPFSLLFMVAEPFGAFSVTVWLFSITTQSWGGGKEEKWKDSRWQSGASDALPTLGDCMEIIGGLEKGRVKYCFLFAEGRLSKI